MAGNEIEVAAPLAELATRIRALINGRNLEYPEAFSEWIDHALGVAPNGMALVLEPGSVIEGDLMLDWNDDFRRRGISAVVNLGDLMVRGAILNADLDGGPLLFVGGDLAAARMDKGGANVVVLGALRTAGPVLCEYNHGVLRVGGDLDCEALIVLDHDALVLGQLRAPRIDWEDGELREQLVPEVFDDPDSDLPNGELLRARLAAGLSVLSQ